MATTTKTTRATKATAPTKVVPPVEPVEEFDFDNWSEEDEAKALAAAVPDVRYIIVERTFVGRLTSGEIVKVPLTLTLDEVDELQADYSTPVDQFKAILKKLGGDDVAKDFSKNDMIEAAILAEKYFRVLQKVQQAAFPE